MSIWLSRPTLCTKTSQTLRKAITLCTKASRHTLSPFQRLSASKLECFAFLSLCERRWMTRDFQQAPVISYRPHPHFTCLHKKEQVLSSADKSSQLLFFSSATSEPFWYLVFSHQNISRICSRSNFGSGICDKGELGDKIGGIHSQTLILPDSMYIWKGIHQGKKIWV